MLPASALSVKQEVKRCGGARAGGKVAQDEPESRQLPLHRHFVMSEPEQTPPACVPTPALFGWRRKRSCLLRKRITYLLVLLQEEIWPEGDRKGPRPSRPNPCLYYDYASGSQTALSRGGGGCGVEWRPLRSPFPWYQQSFTSSETGSLSFRVAKGTPTRVPTHGTDIFWGRRGTPTRVPALRPHPPASLRMFASVIYRRCANQSRVCGTLLRRSGRVRPVLRGRLPLGSGRAR